MLVKDWCIKVMHVFTHSCVKDWQHAESAPNLWADQVICNHHIQVHWLVPSSLANLFGLALLLSDSAVQHFALLPWIPEDMDPGHLIWGLMISQFCRWGGGLRKSAYCCTSQTSLPSTDRPTAYSPQSNSSSDDQTPIQNKY